MTSPREKFQVLLKKLFQFDCAELDFGIYRIMNQKRAVIEQFIEKDLLEGVARELGSGALKDEAALKREFDVLTAKIREELENEPGEAIDAEGNLAEQFHTSKIGRQYLSVRERLQGARSTPEMEADIFNHLYTFFSRYYDEGDFMSQRRYSKRDKYAIPYNGEEVHLHWANSDQYYIKTGENFTDYSYKHGGWTVRFQLRNADVEQNNVKGAKRFFLPRASDVVLDEKAQTLNIPFEYRPLNADEEIRYGSKKKAENGNGQDGGDVEDGNGKGKKKKGQEGILLDAVSAILESTKKNTDALAAMMHEKRKDGDGNPVSLLDHHLRTYTRKNSTDFFIHKDLKGFLERELDFYLKNEVLNLDELEASGEMRSKSWFQMLRAIKAIGLKIIAFVSQIENFQKRLFEKKKFVTEVHYCITLDRVPEEMYPDIAKNKAQIEEWKRLFHIHEIKRDTTQPGFSEPLKTAFLKDNPFLVLDTQYFSRSFKDSLLTSARFLGDATTLDDALDGTIIHSENFQALSLIQARYHEQASCVYIDPPYNTDASAILYKNDYKNSSWLSLIENRLAVASKLMTNRGVICFAIDDEEVSVARQILSRIFAKEIGIAVVRSNPQSRKAKGKFSPVHEYALFFGKSEDSMPGSLEITEKRLARYPKKDDKGCFAWMNFIRTGSNDKRTDRPKLYYPIFVDDKDRVRIPEMTWSSEAGEYILNETAKKNETVVYPVADANGGRIEKNWHRGHERVSLEPDEYRVRRDADDKISIDFKTRIDEDSMPVTWWDNNEYASANYGAAELKELFGDKPFDFPKALNLVVDCLRAANALEGDVIIDFFPGSGTTAHAVIKLNRADKGKRKYLLIEVDNYFNTVLKPRIQKVIYSKDWKDGKPVSRQGSSHAFKYMCLESYEDALDNISFQAADGQAGLQLEDYVLSYMLDFETKESETFLNIAKLDSPFDYKLRLHGKDEPLPVDLPETFSYLVGLHVASRQVYENKGTRYLVYRGKAEGRETVILWRTTRGWGQKEFESDRDFIQKEKLIDGAEDIFVNTDSFIPGARSLDPVFKRRMFNEE